MGATRSLYLTDDVIERLADEPNASEFVVNLVRRQMALEEDRKRQDAAHGPISEQRRAQIRAGVKAKMSAAREAIEGGAYDEVRRQLGLDTGESGPADELPRAA